MVIDEFKDDRDLRVLNRYCDKYPVMVEKKGGIMQLEVEIVYIISNDDPQNWWLGEANRGSFFRRVNEIIQFDIDILEVRAPKRRRIGTLEQRDRFVLPGQELARNVEQAQNEDEDQDE